MEKLELRCLYPVDEPIPQKNTSEDSQNDETQAAVVLKKINQIKFEWRPTEEKMRKILDTATANFLATQSLEKDKSPNHKSKSTKG